MQQWIRMAKGATFASMLCVASTVPAQTARKSLYPIYPQAPAAAPALDPAAVDRGAFGLVVKFIARFQYVNQGPDAAYAEKVLHVYLAQLDPQRLFYSTEDVAGFAAKSGDLIGSYDLVMPKAMADRHAALATQRLERARALLDKGFDGGKPETMDVQAPDDAPFLSAQALDERWRKIVKSDWLQLHSTGKKDADIRAVLTERYRAFATHVQAGDAEDMAERFANAYALASGQGSRYAIDLAPAPAMASRLGVVLYGDAAGPVIHNLTSAATVSQGKVWPADRLIGIAFGDEAVTYLDGWRKQEVDRLLEGKNDDVAVHLLLRRHDVGPGGPVHEATLKFGGKPRGDAASMSMAAADGPGKAQVAVIALKTFYQDYEGKKRGLPNYDSATRDVTQLLEQARQAGVAGVVLDLRGNEGGALSEATGVAGLFLGHRTLWRSRSEQNGLQEVKDDRADAVWTGPLAVMIDGSSAEAAELVASALQDNQRALIIGKTSQGAGNVSKLIDLRRFERQWAAARIGSLMLTTETNFRANGESISGHGVVPDIVLPLAPNRPVIEGPAWVSFDAVPTAEFAPVVNLRKAIPILQRMHTQRVASLPLWNAASHDGIDSRLMA